MSISMPSRTQTSSRKPSSRKRAFLARSIAALLVGGGLFVPATQAATFYWDQNGTAGGFGTGTGNWAEDDTSPGPGRWTTSSAGTLAGSLTQATANTDIFNFGTATLGLSAGTITVSGTVNMGNTTYGAASGEIVLSGGTIAYSAAPIITVNNTTNRIESDIAGAATSFSKAGTGTLVLTGANTFTGSLNVNGGILDLGGGTATGSLDSTVLTLSGGAFNYTRTGSTTQSFTTTNINGGGNLQLSVVSGNTLDLGTITRGIGAAYNFASTGGGTLAALAASNDASGIMPGFTHGDSWAVANGSGVAISALGGGSYTLSTVAGTFAASYLGNIDVENSAGLIDGPITANSLRFSSAAANTMTLDAGTNTLTSGGILVGSGVGSNLSTITGGDLVGAASKDLNITQNNTAGGLTISAIIANNTGATALTKNGDGLLTLDGNNTFTGGVFINAGTVALGNAGALNSTTANAVTFGAGSNGTLRLGGNSVVVSNLSTNTTLAPGSTIVENASATNATLTVGNASNLSGTFAGIIQDGSGGGTLALTKAGTGTLTLSGANSYTGGTILNAGTVNISNATSFGTGSVTVAGSSRINVATGLTYANDITVNSGQTLTLQNPVTATSTATFPGILAGSGTISMPNTSTNAQQGIVAFTNTANTFTGNVVLSASGSGDEHFQFNSIGDGGNFTFAKNGNRQLITYTGSSDITFNTRTIAVASTMINGNITDRQGMDGGGTNPVSSFNNTGSGTVNFTQDMVIGTIASGNYGVLYFGGTNTGNNTYSGVIADPAGAAKLAIGKTNDGKWILSGANTYEAMTLIVRGTLEVPTIIDAANAQPLGINQAFQLGRGGDSGTLSYTGGTSSTDKQVFLGSPINSANGTGGGTIANNGTGALTFTNPIFNALSTTYVNPGSGATTGVAPTVARTLTLSGSYTGAANTIQGVIQNNANTNTTGIVNVVKTGDSTWVLSGTNTYTGTTTVSGGTLVMANTQAFGTGSIARIILSGGGTADIATDGGDTAYNITVGSNANGTIVSNRATAGAAIDHTLGTLNVGASTTAGGTQLNVTAGANVTSGTPSITVAGITLGAGAITLPSIATVNPTTANLLVGTVTATGAAANPKTLNLDGTSSGNQVTGVISNGVTPVAILKTNSSTWTLSGDNTYTGPTTVSGGTLALSTATTNNIASSPTINLSSGTSVLDVTGVTGSGGFTLAAGQQLSGIGTVNGSVAASSTSIVAPGNSAGNLTFANGVDLSAGGVYSWELGALSTSNPGTDFDTITVSGGNLALAGTSALTLDFNLVSATDPNSADAFWTSPRTWKIIDVTTGTNTGDTNLSTITNATYTSGSFTTTVGAGGDAGDVFLVFTPTVVGASTWIGASGDNWTAGTSWTGSVPNSATAEAQFTTTGGAIANLDVDQTVNKLTFDATTSNDYTISGPGKLTLAGTTPSITTTATNTGDQIVAVNLDLAAGTSVSVQGGTLELNSPANAVLGAGVTATVATGATLSLGGTGNALSDGTSTHANVANSGTLAATTAGKRVGEISGTGTTTVNAAGATLTANHIRQSTLNIGAGNTVTVATNGGDSGTSVVSTLSINATGKLDLNDNDLVVDNGNLATLTAQLASGLDINGSYGNGPGITSSAFANNVDFNTVLGIAANSELGYTSFSGQTVDANDVLIKYTYYGDADLSGSVDTSTDFDLYITGLTSGGSLGGWLFGDFDYSGTVDSSTDFDLYITGLTTQGGALLTAGGGGNQVQAVPEPSTFVLGGLALLGFAGVGLRKRRLSA